MKIGVLSDTHISSPIESFLKQTARCFVGCQVIFHAGDLTDLSVLSAFKGKELYAVHGNMCQPSARHNLPTQTVIELGGFRFGLTHGMRYRQNVEENLINDFSEVDCIVSGHTHIPVCHRLFGVLFMNPGSFTGTGRHGAPGTYGILEVGDTLRGRILEVPRP
jgi:hypothetical protein